MITEEEARARADAWINGGVPPERRREVGSYAFDGGWVVWPKEPPREDPSRPPSTVGGGRGVVDAESGELTFWPSLPAPEIARRYVLSRGEGGAGAQPRARGSASAGGSPSRGAAGEVASTDTAGEADASRAATHQSSAPAGFRPVNDLESAMERALQNQDQSGYAAALATAELVVPVRPAPDCGVVTATVQRDGRSHLLTFTSTETMGATIGRDGAELQFIKASVPQMLATWSDPQVWLAVDPGTPIEGYLPPQWLRDHLAAATTSHRDTPAPSQPPA